MEPLISFPLPKERVFCVPEGTIIGLFREELPSRLMPANTTLLFTIARLPVEDCCYCADYPVFEELPLS